jgi:hypothetical protein
MELNGPLHVTATLPRGKEPQYPLGPRADLDVMKRRKISCPCRESNPGRPAHSPSLHRLSYGFGTNF